MGYEWNGNGLGFSIQKSTQAKTYGKVRYAKRDGYYFRNYHREIKGGYSLMDRMIDLLDMPNPSYEFLTK